MIADGMLGSLLANIATDVSGRIFSRLRKFALIDSFLDGPIEFEKKFISYVSNDLKTVFGRRGELTEELDRFLSDLGTTGLLTEMCQSAAAGNDSKGTKQAFSLLLSQHFQDGIVKVGKRRIRTDDFYERLCDAILASVCGALGIEKRVFQSKAFLELSRKNQRALVSSFHASSASGGAESWLSVDRKVVRSVFLELANCQLSQVSVVSIEGPAQKRQTVDLKEIFVPGTIYRTSIDFRSHEAGMSRRDTSRTIGYGSFRWIIDKTVLLGDPGTGKSTLGRMICYDEAIRATKRLGKLPIQLELRKYAASLARGESNNILSYLVKNLSSISFDYTEEELLDPIRNILAFGKALLVFDGVDEVLEVSQRKEMIDEVRAFCSKYPLCPVLITSRKIGYRKAPLKEFDHYDLDGFAEEQVTKYSILCSKHVWGMNHNDAVHASASFRKQVGKDASDLVRIPLLTALMLWLYHQRVGSLPTSKALLIHECSELLFKRWDDVRKIDPDLPDGHRLFQLVTALSKPFYLDQKLGDGASKKSLKTMIYNFLVSDFSYDAEIRANAASERFVEHITDRAWIMTEIAPDKYYYTHRTFLEYFFARFLDDNHETVADLIDSVVPYIVQGVWHVPANLAIQTRVGSSYERAKEVAEILLSVSRRISRREQQELVTFITDLSEFLEPPERHFENFAKLVTQFTSDDVRWKRSFERMLDRSTPMQGAALRGFSQGIEALVRKDSRKKVGVLLDWFYLRKVGLAFDSFGERSKISPEIKRGRAFDSYNELVSLIGVGEGKSFRLMSKRSDGYALGLFHLLGIVDEGALGRSGQDLWCSSVKEFQRYDWIVVDLMLCLRGLNSIESPTDSDFSDYGYLGLHLTKVVLGKKRWGVALPRSSKGVVLLDANLMLSGVGNLKKLENAKHISAAIVIILLIRDILKEYIDRNVGSDHTSGWLSDWGKSENTLLENLEKKSPIGSRKLGEIVSRWRDGQIQFWRSDEGVKRYFSLTDLTKLEASELVVSRNK